MVICRECGREFKQIHYLHLYSHNMTTLEYKAKYPGAEMYTPDILSRMSAPLLAYHGSDMHREVGRRTRIAYNKSEAKRAEVGAMSRELWKDPEYRAPCYSG